MILTKRLEKTINKSLHFGMSYGKTNKQTNNNYYQLPKKKASVSDLHSRLNLPMFSLAGVRED